MFGEKSSRQHLKRRPALGGSLLAVRPARASQPREIADLGVTIAITFSKNTALWCAPSTLMRFFLRTFPGCSTWKEEPSSEKC
jgi:hypothetical protein